MNKRDVELLDKQLWGVSPNFRTADTIGLALVGVFLAGMTIGGVLFANDSKRMQMESHDTATGISLLNNAPLIMR